MNWKKLRSPSRATLTNPNFHSFCELVRSVKHRITPTFKNYNFESKKKLKNAMPQLEFHC